MNKNTSKADEIEYNGGSRSCCKMRGGQVVPTSEHILESDFEQPSGWTERFVQ